MSDTATGGAQGAGTGAAQDQGGPDQGSGQGSNGTNDANGQGSGGGGQGQGSSQQTPEQLQEAIRVREAENASYRERIRKYEADEEKRKQDAMTDEQRRAAEVKAIETERDRLAAELADRDDRAAVVAKARDLGFKNPDLGGGLVNLTEVRKDGKLDAVAVEAKLRERLTADPYLGNGGTGDGAGGRGGQGNAAGDMNAIIRNRR